MRKKLPFKSWRFKVISFLEAGKVCLNVVDILYVDGLFWWMTGKKFAFIRGCVTIVLDKIDCTCVNSSD